MTRTSRRSTVPVGVASASFVRQGKGDEPVGADDYVVEKRNPNELATSRSRVVTSTSA